MRVSHPDASYAGTGVNTGPSPDRGARWSRPRRIDVRPHQLRRELVITPAHNLLCVGFGVGGHMDESIKVVFFDLGDTLVVSDRERREWMPGAKAVLKRLADMGVRLGIISDTADLSREQLLELLPEDFDFGAFEEGLIILSSEVGVEKPDPAIFRLAVKNADVAAHEALFVGESSEETGVAERIGMKVKLVQKFPQDLEDVIRGKR